MVKLSRHELSFCSSNSFLLFGIFGSFLSPSSKPRINTQQPIWRPIGLSFLESGRRSDPRFSETADRDRDRTASTASTASSPDSRPQDRVGHTLRSWREIGRKLFRGSRAGAICERPGGQDPPPKPAQNSREAVKLG